MTQNPATPPQGSAMDVVVQCDVYFDSTVPAVTEGTDVEQMIETLRAEKYADPAVQEAIRGLMIGLDPDEPAGPAHEQAPQPS